LLAGRKIDGPADCIQRLRTDTESRVRRLPSRTGRRHRHSRKEILSATGLKIERVDAVGAGDTYCGYLAASLEQGNPFETALKRAASAGSLACLKQGAQTSMPAASLVDAALIEEN